MKTRKQKYSGQHRLAGTAYHWEILKPRVEEFVRKDYKQRHFFPHQIYHLPRGGPDGMKMAYRLCKILDPALLWEILLFALPPALSEFPDKLFFDKELIWHEQHFGKKGHVAVANVVLSGTRMCGTDYWSDIFQRISRRRDYKTRVEKLFKGWPQMAFNALMHFALSRGVRVFYSPTSDLVVEKSDPTRRPERELFERIYDRPPQELFSAVREGPWWRIDVLKNRDRIIVPARKKDIRRWEKSVCICHDTERGWGHRDVDPEFARYSDKISQAALPEMLNVERSCGIKTTYAIVGTLWKEIKTAIEAEGHACAFHSYDHCITEKKRNLLRAGNSPAPFSEAYQLSQCRKLDYRIKGYRVPQSKIAPDLTDENLSFYNFEWLASSASSLQEEIPKLKRGIVKIPVLFDDFPLHKQQLAYTEWEKQALLAIETHDFVCFGLHDCYSPHWLPYYESFIEKIVKRLGSKSRLKTLDEVSAEVILSNAE